MGRRFGSRTAERCHGLPSGGRGNRPKVRPGATQGSSCANPGIDTAPGPGSPPLVSVVESKAGGMQKTLTRVELFIAPLVRSPAGSPISAIELASACAKAPLRFCSQLVNGEWMQSASDAQPFAGNGGFWKPPSGSLHRPQKMFDLPFPAPVLN